MKFLLALCCSLMLVASAASAQAKRSKALPLKTQITNAEAAYAAGNYAEAQTLYTALIKKQKRNALFYKERGNTHLNQSNFDAAIADYNMALKLKKNYVKAVFNRGLAYYAKGENVKAMTDYDRAATLLDAPAKVKPADLRKRGLTPKDLGEPIAAEKIFYARGILRYKQADYQVAAQDFSEAIARKADYSEAYDGRASARFGLKQYKESASDFEKVKQLTPASTRPEPYLKWIRETAAVQN